MNDIISMAGNTIFYIFLMGPLNIFLKLKEGKTSFEKLQQDYEDERMSMMPPNENRSGVLPDNSIPVRRRNARPA